MFRPNYELLLKLALAQMFRRVKKLFKPPSFTIISTYPSSKFNKKKNLPKENTSYNQKNFLREFKPMAFAPDDSSLSSDQDTNQFLV